MEEKLIAERIVTDYKTFAGKPTVRDTRVAVEHVLGMMADGATYEDILRNYPFLEEDDIRACVMYAWQIVSHEHIEPLHKSDRKDLPVV
jgi:uncharacterized protein (DUF433 family)